MMRLSFVALVGLLVLVGTGSANAQVTKYDRFDFLGGDATAAASWQVVCRPRPEACSLAPTPGYATEAFNVAAGSTIRSTATAFAHAIDLCGGFPSTLTPLDGGWRVSKNWAFSFAPGPRACGLNGCNVCVSIAGGAFTMIAGATPDAGSPITLGTVEVNGQTLTAVLKRKAAHYVPAVPSWAFVLLLAGLAALSLFFMRRKADGTGGLVG